MNSTNDYFVSKDSIVRQIWGKSDVILFIFAGAAAEFALSKAVDWLYFTGRLPKDPLGRLFTTVSYARAIVFSERDRALNTIDAMNAIHAKVEETRESSIPNWAYQDVLFMLIDYSIRSFELLERKLTNSEKAEVFAVFHRMGVRMGIQSLPATFDQWCSDRKEHLSQNLVRSVYTDDLFAQYKKHLGVLRYRILLEAQAMVVPNIVRDWLGLRNQSLFVPVMVLYKLSKHIKLDIVLKALILPAQYKDAIAQLDNVAVDRVDARKARADRLAPPSPSPYATFKT